MQEQKNFRQVAADLVAQYERQPRLGPETITKLPAYRPFIEEAVRAGWTGPEMELDPDFWARSAEWVASASDEQRRRWLHSVLRSERWNAECPMAILEALQGGQMAAFVTALREPA
ncbi:hypothetical protein [Afifella aestuarii]|uniref:hypothetical protein n=1 Tax=Afifella aestuarii TaxID=1909496 RepID=UPI000FE38164|nr:hypothetical protein [Afifella aestuarii]